MLNKFSENKLIFIEDLMFSNNTKERYWSILDSDLITTSENNKDKDLYEFTSDEIIEVVSALPTTKIRTQKQVLSVINRYINHAIERGWLSTGINPCDVIKANDDIHSNKESLKRTYMNLDEFYNWIENLEASDVDIMLLVLLRYGCTMKEICNLVYDDVNVYDKTLNVNGKKYPIDGMFVNYVEKAYCCNEYEDIVYQDSNYIIKPTQKTRSNKVNENSLRNKMTMIADKNSIDRPSINALNKSRKFDLILSIYNEKKILYYSDIEDVLKIFDDNMTDNKSFVLKENFEEMFNIKVHKNKRKII